MYINIQLRQQRWQPFGEDQGANQACSFFYLSEISEQEDPLSKVKIEASESMDQGEDESSNDKIVLL